MISLVIYKDIETSVRVNKHAFPIENGKVAHAEDQKAGYKFCGMEEQYNKAHELAAWAHKHKLYDEIVRTY